MNKLVLDWSQYPINYMYAAMDDNGVVNLYEYEPVLAYHDGWIQSKGGWIHDVKLTRNSDIHDWKNSLTKRPKKVRPISVRISSTRHKLINHRDRERLINKLISTSELKRDSYGIDDSSEIRTYRLLIKALHMLSEPSFDDLTRLHRELAVNKLIKYSIEIINS